MARKKIGIVELQWKCPKCQALNAGSQRLCQGCGAPQPDDVMFEAPERQELITDQAVAGKASAADIHCPYCGTRNPAGSKTCSQCQGDLVEGKKREAGRVVGAFKSGPVGQISCPHCGTANPDTAKICQQCGGSLAKEEMEMKPATAPAARPIPRSFIWIGMAVSLIVCGGLALLAGLSSRTKAIVGSVQNVSWQRSIPIEGFVPAEYQDWQDQIPAGAELGECSQQVRSVQDEPVENSVEVCGTPYTIDSGSGFGQVVQDCEYQVYDVYCSYSVLEWRQVDVASLSGQDNLAAWPSPVLQEDQRLGENGSETYSIIFSAGEQLYTFETSDYTLFQQARVGTIWDLSVNSFGNVVSIEP